MTRFALIVVCVSLIAGCSDSEPVTSTQTANQQFDAQSPETQARAYGKKLADLRDQARSLESEMNFAAAAEVWQRIQNQVSSDFGGNSWQAINAKIAHKAAQRNDQLKPNYSTELRQIASLQANIKSAFMRDQYSQALDLSGQLLRLQEPLFGEISMDIARLKLQIGTLQNKFSLDEPALQNLHAGVGIFRARGIELHPELEAALASLADIYTRQKKYRPAVANQKAATQLAGHLWGTDNLQYARQANQLGVIFHRAGNHSVAFDILNTAKQIRAEKLGTDSVEYAHSCLNLGIVTLSQQKLDQAQKLLVEARTIFGEKQGVADEYTIRSNAQLATVMMLQNRPDLAEKLLDEVVRAGGSSISTSQLVNYKYKLAIALARQGKYETAEPLLQEILGQQKTVHGSSSTQVASTLKALVKVYEATHQKSKLNSIREQLNQITRVASGDDFQARY